MGRRWLGPLLVATTVAAASTAAAGPLYVVKRHPSEVRFRTVYTGDWVHASRIAADIVVNANFYWKTCRWGSSSRRPAGEPGLRHSHRARASWCSK